jgi:hypothetical protein
MHGGTSTGPRTAEGRRRISAARTTHGFWSPESRALHRYCRELLDTARLWLAVTHANSVWRRQHPLQSGDGTPDLRRQCHCEEHSGEAIPIREYALRRCAPRNDIGHDAWNTALPIRSRRSVNELCN